MPVLGIISCHPPIIIPEIGGNETKKVQKTIDALKLAASEVEKFNPEVTLIMSPHAVALNGEKVPVQVTDKYTGDFADFGAPHVTMRYDCSTEDAYALKGCGASAIRYGLMDHGSMVPLYYLRPSSPLVIMGYAFSLSTKGYITFGSCMRQLFEGRRVLFIASGDLSHRLLPDAPAGYHPDAKRFDLKLVEAVKNWSLDKYLLLEDFRDLAGECGYWSIATLFGFMGPKAESDVLSYEGPFGVGYAVAVVKESGE
ncbi:MAG TPA: class III extradiol dioxygenase subunit B-like domain-containing protein [Coprothermobacter proteolyticus]|nr:class III extradiol dioxygenase subunit B-like domain-containing protein [Coprothermobacter proteolyticus]HOL52899.1 class III extradiol dioxygenase subunit B-like domain-containing protein [Coprothermobacter proteolyticus]HPO83497.1 class III extradiol dioxygenase subunit B-like domain-containing protein [Coprothermobacter proteolyticus]